MQFDPAFLGQQIQLSVILGRFDATAVGARFRAGFDDRRLQVRRQAFERFAAETDWPNRE